MRIFTIIDFCNNEKIIHCVKMWKRQKNGDEQNTLLKVFCSSLFFEVGTMKREKYLP